MRKLFVIALLLSSLFGICQAPLSITITNEQDTPLEGATVSLLRGKDSGVLKVTLTDKRGKAEFDNFANGEYLLSITEVSYQRKFTDRFHYSGQPIQLTPVSLLPSTATLKEVTLQAKKPFIERKIDRLVINVENSIINAGNTAFEVLEKSPGVQIDQNDNISLKGKAGVVIMIDGKPSPLSGSDLSSFLRGQPSSAIERIEIIANPSSKFDAAGNAGVINIIMKKDKRLGTNGSLNLSAGQGIYFKTNSGVNFNYRNRKVNVFGNLSYLRRRSLNDLTINRSFYTNGQKTGGLNLFNHMLYPTNNYSGRFGADFFLSKKTVAGVLLNGLINDQGKTVDNRSTNTDKDGKAMSHFTTNSFTKDLLDHYGLNFNLKHTIDTKGQEISIDLDKARFDKKSTPSFVTSYYDVNNSPTAPPYLLDGNMKGLLTIYSAKSDYVKPLNKNAKIEAGVKTSFVKADNDLVFQDKTNGTPQYDATRSNHFIYKENINAAYAQLNREFKQLNVQIGLRAEQSNIYGVQKVSDEKIDTSYLKLFPSAFLTYKIRENHELGFSYSRRIQRPTYVQLNPFKSFIDLTSYNTGDPYLRPQFTNSFELSYTYKQKTTLSLSYAHSTDVIAWIIKPLSTPNGLVSVETNDNISRSDSYDLNISDQHSITKWWTSVTNADFFLNKNHGVIENTIAKDGSIACYLTSNHTFTLSKKWTSELALTYQSAQQVAYAYSRAQWSLAAGFQKIIFSGKGSLRVNVTDIFRTFYPRVTSTFSNYSQYFTAFRDTRAVNVTLAYRFGKNTVQAARRRTSGVEDEKNRAN